MTPPLKLPLQPMAQPLSQPLSQPLIWQAGRSAEWPYQAEVAGAKWQIRLGDFPAEALYALWINDQWVQEFDDWPAVWQKPAKS
jgi:hypothetical protein